MGIKSVAVLSPGEMGSAVGRVFRDGGLNVMTCLAGRSDRTKALSREAGLREVETLQEVVAQAELVLSILVPAEALGVASSVAGALRANGGQGATFADCNAVSPQTAVAMSEAIESAGGSFIDVSIIGGPPRGGRGPRFYVSGRDVTAMSDLDSLGIEVRHIGDAVGRASGIKMCYGGLTKGTSALQLALLAAAEAMDLSEPLRQELRSSQAEAYERMERSLPSVPSKAFRWIGEMEEVAATFESLGLTPRIHEGAADLYRALSETPMADVPPERIEPGRTLTQTVEELAEAIKTSAQSRS